MKPLPDPDKDAHAISDENLFAAALKWETPAQRMAYLDEICADNPDQRARVESLLKASDEAQTFLERPVGTPRPALGSTTAPAKERVNELLPSPEGPGSRVGRYKLHQQIGEGGCGTVFMAEQEEPVRRRVALKVIKLGMDTKSVVARFEAERQALAMMDHPNIAKVLDAGATDSGRPFFVMELVRGIPITRYCNESRLDTKARLHLFIQVCQAIQHAHQKGIIHRDIKPSNILVTLHDGVPVPKVIDFGIAKATEGRLTDRTLLTAFEQFIGTPAYMSPEQAEMSGLDIDTRSDIYALGVLLYELLTGNTPFDAKELAQSGFDAMRKTIREREPQRPSTRLTQQMVDAGAMGRNPPGSEPSGSSRRRLQELVNLIRGDLDWIVMKCLEKDRTRRYDTANGLAADLKRHLENEPVVARPPSTVYRMQKVWRRNRLACVVGLSLALILVVGIAFTSVLARRADQARMAALQASEQELQQRRAADSARRAETELRERAEVSERASRLRAYTVFVNLAQKALANDDLTRALELLDSQRPSEGKEDLRGWEWRFLRGQCRADEHLTLVKGSTPLSALTLSPDGRFLAYADMDASVSLMDLSTQQIVLRTQGSGDLGSIGRWRMDFSPAEPLFAVHEALPDGTFRILLWNTALQRIHSAIPSHKILGALRFTPDGRQLLISDSGEGLHLREIAKGGKVKDWPGITIGHGFNFASDGKTAAAVTTRRSLCLLDLDAQSPEQRMIHTADEFVGAVAVTTDDSTIASTDIVLDTEITLWDWKTTKPMGRLQGHRAFVHHLAFSPDNRLLASASADKTVRLWDWRAGRCVSTFRGHSSEVWAVAFTPDGKFLLTASKDGSIRKWPVQPKPDELPFRLIPGFNFALGFTADNRWVITGNRTNGSVLRWGVSPALPPQPILNAGTNAAMAQLSPDRSRLLVGYLDGWVREWDLVNGLAIHQKRFGEKPILSIAYLADGNAWAVPVTNSIVVWNPKLGRSEGELPLSLREMFNQPGWATAPSANLIAANTTEGFMVWDATHRKLVGNVATDHPFNSISFSPDGRCVVATRFNPVGIASAWSVADLKCLGDFQPHLLECFSAAFSLDNRRIITGGVGNEAVRVWDAETRMELVTLPAPLSEVGRVEFSPDGNHIVASGQFGNSVIWSAPTWAELEAMTKLSRRDAP